MMPRTASRTLGTASRACLRQAGAVGASWPAAVGSNAAGALPAVARPTLSAARPLAAIDMSSWQLQRREIHMASRPENLPLIIGLGVGAGAIGLKYLLEAYPKWKAARDVTKAAFRSPYKGGFEEEMTKREAALILGVRESAKPERIKERHRKLLMANHPDAGGSTFIATKLNEAKEMLLGSR